MENPDLIPIYYFQHDVLDADAKMISGSLCGGYCQQRLANATDSQQTKGKVFKHQSDEAAS
jgi:hypothetical protein